MTARARGGARPPRRRELALEALAASASVLIEASVGEMSVDAWDQGALAAAAGAAELDPECAAARYPAGQGLHDMRGTPRTASLEAPCGGCTRR